MEILLTVVESAAMMTRLLEGKEVAVPVIKDRHTSWCLTHWAEFLVNVQSFTAIFPNYCKECGGTGGLTTRDSVPYGSGNVTMEGEEPCGHCLDEGICPLCGKKDGWIEYIPSTENSYTEKCSCGYDSSNVKLHAPEFECYCYDLEAREAHEEFDVTPGMDWVEEMLLAGDAPATDFVERRNDEAEGF